MNQAVKLKYNCLPRLVKSWKVHVTNSMFFANSSHDWSDLWIVPCVHPWKQMMLDLVVQTSREQGHPEPAVVRRALYLQLRPADLLGLLDFPYIIKSMVWGEGGNKYCSGDCTCYH